jgi:hypothetical protein
MPIQTPIKTMAVRQDLREERTLKLLLLACLRFSANSIAIGGRGGGVSEGAHFGDGGGVRFGGRLGGSGNDARPSVTRDRFGNRLPGVVTADEEGRKIHGQDYDPDSVDLTERVLYRNEYAVLPGGDLTNWQSSSDAIGYRARGVRTLAVLFSLTIPAIAMCMFAYR